MYVLVANISSSLRNTMLLFFIEAAMMIGKICNVNLQRIWAFIEGTDEALLNGDIRIIVKMLLQTIESDLVLLDEFHSLRMSTINRL